MIKRGFVTLTSLLIASLAWGRSLDFSQLSDDLRGPTEKRAESISNGALTLEKVDEILRFLQSQPGVEQAFADEGEGDRIILRVVIARRINSVRFQGLHVFSESEARTHLGVNKGEPYDQDSLLEGAERLRQAYRNAGYLNPLINIENPPVQGSVDLQVKIDEGHMTEIRQYRVISADPALNRRLEGRLNSRKSGSYTESRLLDAQSLLRDDLRGNMHLRADVSSPEVQFSADETAATVIFRLERVESYSIDFRGQKDLSSRYLEEEILDLRNFSSSNPNVASELTEKIKQAYLARGYARAEVTAEESDGRTPYSRRILFTIVEGPKINIEKISVTGRFSRPADEYADFIRTNSSPIVKSGYYNREDLETGFKNLVLDLQNRGFLVAKIVSTRTQYNRERTKITVHVNLDEGPLTVVEVVNFENNVSVPWNILLEEVKIRPGEPLKLNQIEQAIQSLKNFYHDSGYIEMQLLNEREDLVTYNEDNTKARLHFRIYEGPQVRVASIITDGNTFTKDQVILNELDFATGDLLTPGKIEESVARLQRTGYFGTVEIRTLEEKTSVANRTVIVRVTERDPGVFTLGAGATNERDLTLRGYTGVAYRNLYGTGRGVSARVDTKYNVAGIQYPELKGTLGYVEPYLFNARVRGRINLTRQRTVTDYETTQISELTETTYSIERDFTSHVFGSYTVWSLATIEDFFLDDSKARGGVKSNLDIASTGPSLDLDYRDNPFNPTRGHLSKFSVEFSSPKIGSDRIDEFWKANASFTYYSKLGTSGVGWVNSLRFGFLESLSGGVDGGIPYDKKGFILGGRSTLRGYEAGTSDVFPNSTDLGSTQYRLLTRAKMGLIKSEFHVPVYGKMDGILFYDGGSVRIDGLDFADSYRDSAGVGIRYNTPVGPFNLEFGWKLDQRPGESPYRFHISMGSL